MSKISSENIIIRTTLQSGDIGYIIFLHGILYQQEYNFGIGFESYVAAGLHEFYTNYDPEKDRVWICEHENTIVGSLFLAHKPGNTAQLRYFLLRPEYQTAVTYNMDHSFTINKSFGADASLQYQSPLQYGIFKINGQTVLNLDVRKSFDNNKVNLRFNVGDIFNSRSQHLSTTYQNMNSNFTEKAKSRIARLSVTYRFGRCIGQDKELILLLVAGYQLFGRSQPGNW